MKSHSSSGPAVEKGDEAGFAAEAKITATDGDAERDFAHLRQAGKWILEVAKKVGTEIIAMTLARLL
jgi:hypothetical protein